VTPNAVIVPGRVVDETVRLGRRPAADKGPTGCPGVPSLSGGFLGVSFETQTDFAFPFRVSVHTQDIGGPSAGLAMTLGIIDKLSSGSITGGHVVAATGTIDEDGNVGDVGGVPQKTVAVERAGATVFWLSHPDPGRGARAPPGPPPGRSVFPCPRSVRSSPHPG
jgi:hypothetical protein